jgi:hypothetical protein
MLRYRILVALALTVGAPAVADPKAGFGESDGERFEYTAELQANGMIHFAGAMRGSGDRFELDVARNGRVEGHFGDRAVDYFVAKEIRNKVAADLGEGPMVADATPRK